jgi:transcriptional regulator PpsR
MTRFADPTTTFSDLTAESVSRLISGCADLALVVDAEGIICDVAYGPGSLDSEKCESWVGQPLIQTVTKDSRAKIAALLRDAENAGVPRWRQINHLSPRGGDLLLSYCAVKVDDEGRQPALGRSVVFGRDMRALSDLQQRLIDAQQEALQDNWRLRDTQSRNRHLFQTASDGVLIVDASTQRVVEANPVAMLMFGDKAAKLIGSVFPYGLDDRDTQAVQNMLATVRTSGNSEGVRAQLGGAVLNMAGSMFRQEVGSLLVVRLTRTETEIGVNSKLSSILQSALLKLVQSSPDCIVVTDAEGLIVSANESFLELVHLTAESQVRTESLGRWLGRTGVELSVLITTLRQRGSIRLFPTCLRDDHGSVTDIEISATLTHESEGTLLGFMIRDVSRRQSTLSKSDKELPRSASQLAELVGRVPMKDIVGETSDLIEQLCIEAALDLTRDNRAAAAEMLGLSRQSLYVKLRRYGMSDPLADGEK